MATPEPFDAILIGAGQAANPLARSLARAGWKVALAERSLIGGTCVNWGCTPTKTMVASARVAYLAGWASDYGVHLNGLANCDGTGHLARAPCGAGRRLRWP